MLPALLTLLMVLAAVSHGTAPLCDISKNKAMHRCYGALGQSVFIYILDNNSEIDLLIVFFNNKLFFEYREGRKSNTPCQNRCQVMSNGTLRLDNLTENHSGMYLLQAFDSYGTSLLKRSISLTIQDPVTPPVLSQLCLSHGEIRVSCSSTGEPPQYSWTLDGRALDGGVAFFSSETQTVILRRNVSGSITCEVSNRVSKERTTQVLLTCPGFKTYTELLCVFGVLVIILCSVLCITLWNRGRKRFYTGGGLSAEYSDVVYVPVQIVNSNKGAPGEGCGLA